MEYPFKDLLPLDEVLAREGYYKDWTHLDPEVFYSLTQISEYIKTKGYGVDVRLLIAQLAEHFGLKTTQVVDLANLLSTKHDALKDQFDVVIRDATSGADWGGEIVLARGGKPTLQARLDETTAQLAQTTSKQNGYIQHFSGKDPYWVERNGTIHTGGHHHTAFFGGCTFKGKEIYVARNSEQHNTTATRGVIVGYIREHDGTFTRKIVVPPSEVDPRDPNLSTSRDGSKLFLSCACTVGNTSTNANYITYLWELDEELNIIGGRKKLFDGFGWGNVLITPSGKLLKTRYHLAQAFTGVKLFRSTNHFTSADLTSQEIATIFPLTAKNPSECTLAYWDDKLIAVSRQDGGNTVYRETYNLEGDDGWGDIIDLGFQGHAPALLPYNRNQTLIANISILLTTDAGLKYRRQAITTTDNGVDWTAPIITESKGGSYGTLVPNRYGLGNMYFAEYDDGANSDVFHSDIDINQIARVNNLEKPIKMDRRVEGADVFIGDCTDYNFIDTAEETQRYIYFKFKKDTVVNGFYAYTKDYTNGTISNQHIVFQKMNADGTKSDVISVFPTNLPTFSDEPNRVSFIFSTPVTFVKGQIYRINLFGYWRFGKKALINNNRTIMNADLGRLIYVKSTSFFGVAEVFENTIYPLEFGIVE